MAEPYTLTEVARQVIDPVDPPLGFGLEEIARLKPQSIVQDGSDQADQERWKEAVNYFEISCASNPGPSDSLLVNGSAKANFACGVAATNVGNLEKADRHFRAAIDRGDEFFSPHLALGRLKFWQGELAEAIVHYGTFVGRVIDCAPAFTELAWILATAKQRELRDGVRAADLSLRACRVIVGSEKFGIENVFAAFTVNRPRNEDFENARLAFAAATAEVGDLQLAQRIVRLNRSAEDLTTFERELLRVFESGHACQLTVPPNLTGRLRSINSRGVRPSIVRPPDLTLLKLEALVLPEVHALLRLDAAVQELKNKELYDEQVMNTLLGDLAGYEPPGYEERERIAQNIAYLHSRIGGEFFVKENVGKIASETAVYFSLEAPTLKHKTGRFVLTETDGEHRSNRRKALQPLGLRFSSA